jgi:uncharacterized protein YciI
MTKLLLAALLALPLCAQPGGLYQLVFLRPDPARKAVPQPEMDRIMAAHMANIHAMADRGVLVAAGPFGDTPPTISGIFVFKTASLDEARRIASADPTVVEHRNTVEVYAWRGPAGIGDEYVRLHKGDPKTPDDMGVHPLYLLRRGPAWTREGAGQAHDHYLAQLRRDAKIAAAGPIEGDGDLVGVLIFRRMSDDDARRLMEADPAVQSGALRSEYHHWWCAAHVLPE